MGKAQLLDMLNSLYSVKGIPIIWSIYPLVICYIAIENGPIEIVDLPIKHADFP